MRVGLISFLGAMALFTLSCKDKAAGTSDSGDTASGDSDGGSGDGGDTGGPADGGGDGGAAWDPGPMRPGNYVMTVQSVTDNQCGGNLQGAPSIVEITMAGQFPALWGYAIIEIEPGGDALRVSGSQDIPTGGCTLTETTSATGTLVNPANFNLDFQRDLSGTGDCSSLPVTLPCSQVFSAAFSPDEGGGGGGDTGTPDPA